MRVHVLVPLALLFTLQQVAGSLKTVVIDDDNEFAWETNQQYASESPWPSTEVSTSSFSMAPSMNYPEGMASKETSMPGSSETGFVGFTEFPDEVSSAPVADKIVETETVFITLSGAGDSLGESAEPAESAEPMGPGLSAAADSNNNNVVVAPEVEVNVSIINGVAELVSSTIIPDSSEAAGPATVTVTAGESSSPAVVTVTEGLEESSGPAVVTVTAGAPSSPAVVTVTAGEPSSPGVVTVTAGAAEATVAGAVATQTVMETVLATSTQVVTETAQATVGFSPVPIDKDASQAASFAGASAGGVAAGGDVNAQQVGHSTYVQTVMTASYDIVRVIGPSYTSTISMHMQQYENGQAVGLGSDLISMAPATSSAVVQVAQPTSNMVMYGNQQVVAPAVEPQSSYQGGIQGGIQGGSSSGSFSYEVQGSSGAQRSSGDSVQAQGSGNLDNTFQALNGIIS